MIFTILNDAMLLLARKPMTAEKGREFYRLCDTICSLTADTIFSITGRDWIIKAFN